jgi:uncharacterized protein YutE (UPF0331/DUF86 family)
MVYQVDTDRIQTQLAYLKRCGEVLDKVGEPTDESAFFAASRALHIGVECVIDVGSLMIDGFLMRDPGGYEDIIDILEDEQVIPKEGADRLKELVRVRNRLIRHYVAVDTVEVAKAGRKAEVFRQFIFWVENYLKQELGCHPKEGDGG